MQADILSPSITKAFIPGLPVVSTLRYLNVPVSTVVEIRVCRDISTDQYVDISILNDEPVNTVDTAARNSVNNIFVPIYRHLIVLIYRHLFVSIYTLFFIRNILNLDRSPCFLRF